MPKKRLFPVISFLIIFASLVGLLFYGLFFASDPKQIPSALISKPAADFTVTDLEGREFSLSSFNGRPVILNFWASWCPPCKEEAVILEKAYQDYRDAGAVFIGIAMSDTLENARQAAKDYEKTFLLALDPNGGQLSIDYGVTGVPETFFIGKDLSIHGKKTGIITRQEIDEFLSKEL